MSGAGMHRRFDPPAATGDNRWTYHLPSRCEARVQPCKVFDDACLRMTTVSYLCFGRRSIRPVRRRYRNDARPASGVVPDSHRHERPNGGRLIKRPCHKSKALYPHARVRV